MGKIIVVGSINMDVVGLTQKLPQPGETVIGAELHYFPGGKGSNQAVAASRLGDQVYLAGKLGKDGFGKSMQEFLEQENLILDYLTFSDSAPTGIALITVDAKSENTIVVIPGSNGELDHSDIDAIPLNRGDIVVCQFEIPQETIFRLFKRATANNATTILNPAPAATFVPGLLELTDCLVVNETELAFLTDSEIAEDDFDKLKTQALKLQVCNKQKVVVTLGAKGIVCLQDNDLIEERGLNVKAVDTTGAGDCFVGAFAVALADGRTLEHALRFANVAAALSVQKMGASTSMPQRTEVDKLL